MRLPFRSYVFALGLALSGCAEPPTGTVSEAVEDGVASTVEGTVWVVYPRGTCGGAVVGDRWVVTPDYCTEAGPVRVSTDLAGPGVEVMQLHAGPELESSLEPVGITLLELAEPLDVSPLLLAAEPMDRGDEVTVVGGGASRDPGPITEGTFRVDDATRERFVIMPTGSHAACANDQTVLDASGQLAGLLLFGETHPSFPGCTLRTTGIQATVFRDFVQTTMATTEPDAGMGADAGTTAARDAGVATDAGAPAVADGGSARDAGAPRDDTAPESPSEKDGMDGGGCAAVGAAGATGPPWAAALLLVIGLGLGRARHRRI